MQNFDFIPDELGSDLGLSSLSDIEIEFDWDKALESVEENEVVDLDIKLDSPQPEETCIYQQLLNLYHEEKSTSQDLPCADTVPCLLDKLIQQENYNMVLVTLHPFSEGYSLGICTKDGNEVVENLRPYSQQVLLDYLDREELPPPFLEHWGKSYPQLFYSGCVIVRIKDARYSLEPHIRHVLLRPHTQSLINDANYILLEKDQYYSFEHKISVESVVVNACQGPLCLDPSMKYGISKINKHATKNALNTPPLNEVVIKNSQVDTCRSKRADELGMQIYDNLKALILDKKKKHGITRCELVKPTSFKEKDEFVSFSDLQRDFKDAKHLSKPISKRNEDNDVDNTPKLIEEYILEPEPTRTGRGPIIRRFIKIEISQLPATSEYIGTLHVDTLPRDPEHPLALLSFTIGTKVDVNVYIEHFSEIFTREAGKTVKIIHKVPGQPPRETRATPHGHHPKCQRRHNAKPYTQPNEPLKPQQQKRNCTRLTLGQLEALAASGKRIGGPSGPQPNIITGENFDAAVNNAIARLAKAGLVNGRNIKQQQKIIARKLALQNRMNAMLANASIPSQRTSIKLPISTAVTTSQGIQEQVLARSGIGLHTTVNVNAISQSHSSVNSINTSDLKGFKPNIIRSVGNVHSIAGTIEASSNLQTVSVPTVRIISGAKEKQLPTNGQNTASSLSLSLPGLSALLAGTTSSDNRDMGVS